VTWEFALGHALFAFGRVAAGAHDAENRLVQGISCLLHTHRKWRIAVGSWLFEPSSGNLFYQFHCQVCTC
jgi:hypothetical protein